MKSVNDGTAAEHHHINKRRCQPGADILCGCPLHHAALTLTLTFDLLNWKLAPRVTSALRNVYIIFRFFSTLFCFRVSSPIRDRRTGKAYAAYYDGRVMLLPGILLFNKSRWQQMIVSNLLLFDALRWNIFVTFRHERTFICLRHIHTVTMNKGKKSWDR